jgi:hypothetical protein
MADVAKHQGGPVGAGTFGRREDGEGSGRGGRHVAPQQSPPHRGDPRQRVDEQREMTIEETGPGPNEQRPVIVDDLRPGVAGGLCVGGEGGVAGRRR